MTPLPWALPMRTPTTAGVIFSSSLRTCASMAFRSSTDSGLVLARIRPASDVRRSSWVSSFFPFSLFSLFLLLFFLLFSSCFFSSFFFSCFLSSLLGSPARRSCPAQIKVSPSARNALVTRRNRGEYIDETSRCGVAARGGKEKPPSCRPTRGWLATSFVTGIQRSL